MKKLGLETENVRVFFHLMESPPGLKEEEYEKTTANSSHRECMSDRNIPYINCTGVVDANSGCLSIVHWQREIYQRPTI